MGVVVEIGSVERRFSVGEGESLKLVFLVLDGGRVDCAVDLAGMGAEVDIHVLWVAGGEQRPVVEMTVNHLVPDCRSFQLVKGVASGCAVGSFMGMVHVERHARRTSALQQSRNLLLSDHARVVAKPLLEIYADDVKCSHGATVGQMDDQAIFYMRQRGLSEAAARRLQLRGFVDEILEHIPDPSERERAEEMVEACLSEI